jgi:O-acetyl-ADP-ribose deacetylase (regulator of RNase III)
MAMRRKPLQQPVECIALMLARALLQELSLGGGSFDVCGYEVDKAPRINVTNCRQSDENNERVKTVIAVAIGFLFIFFWFRSLN